MHIKAQMKWTYKKFVFNFSKNQKRIFKVIYTYFYKPRKGSLDEIVNLFSKNNRGLTVVQVGANDGFNHDPIYKFIIRDAWKGVLLEPLPQVYSKFLEPLHRNNTLIVTLNAAMDVNDGERDLYIIGFSESRWATGLSSFNKTVIENDYKTGHVARCAAKEGVTIPENKDEQIKNIKIETISTQSLLSRFSIEKVDWLQIDTEGFDYEIIKMFNLDIHKPRVIVFEHSHLSDNDLEESATFLADKGYFVKRFGGNTMAMLQEEAKIYFE